MLSIILFSWLPLQTTKTFETDVGKAYKKLRRGIALTAIFIEFKTSPWYVSADNTIDDDGMIRQYKRKPGYIERPAWSYPGFVTVDLMVEV